MAVTVPRETEPAISPYLEGNYAPIHREITAENLEVIGELPDDLAGMFIRTGSNPRFHPNGRYHWFDGDGMLHGIELEDGSATYRNRYIRTKGLEDDMDAGRSLRTGIMEQPEITNPDGPWKDTANTDLVFHSGKLLALWWLSGKAHEIRLPDLETEGPCDFGGTLDTNMASHAKVDPATGEMIFIDYGPLPPYLRYGVVSPDGEVVHSTPIELPGFRLQHDVGLTQNHALLFDMSMMWDPEEIKQGRVRLGFFPERASRIGVIPRYGDGGDVRWFETEPFFMYHTIACWEEGEEIVMIGCRIPDPMGWDAKGRSGRNAPLLGNLRIEPYLSQWRLNMRTGAVDEAQMDDRITEFPRINDRFLARQARYSYNGRIADSPTMLFDGFVKYDLTDASSEEYGYPQGWYGGEPSFAPSTNARAEDDGYLLTFVAQEATGRSELYVVHAQTLETVAKVVIPQRVPTGYHTRWVDHSDLNAASAAHSNGAH
jgi:carotenoid cleavage dioxygenase-like enzyme